MVYTRKFVFTYNSGQNIWNKVNQTKLDRTTKRWYLLLRIFRLLLPKLLSSRIRLDQAVFSLSF